MMPNPEYGAWEDLERQNTGLPFLDLAMDFRRFTISFQPLAEHQPAKSTLDVVRRIDYLPRCNTVDVGVQIDDIDPTESRR